MSFISSFKVIKVVGLPEPWIFFFGIPSSIAEPAAVIPDGAKTNP